MGSGAIPVPKRYGFPEVLLGVGGGWPGNAEISGKHEFTWKRMISIFSVKLWVFHETHAFCVNLRPGGDPRARTRLKPMVYWWFREVRLRAEWCISHQRLESVPKTFCVREYIFLRKFRIPQKSWNFAIHAKNINFVQGITRVFSIRRTLAFPSRIFHANTWSAWV